MQAKNNIKSQVNLTKLFKNFGTNLSKFAHTLHKKLNHRYLIGS